MNNCPFCYEFDDSLIIHRDELTYSIISLNPINNFHAMVIPHHHYESFVELPNELASHIFLKAKIISKAIREICNPIAMSHLSDDDLAESGINLVPHYKLHIFPRFSDDKVKIEWGRKADPGTEGRANLAAKIREGL